MDLEALKFPLGRVEIPEEYSHKWRAESIHTIAAFPTLLNAAIDGLSSQELAQAYRPGGWSIRQVVHHLADSHMNAFLRFKMALTEDHPTIKPYDEADFASLADAENDDVFESILIIDGLHPRWVKLLKSIKEQDWNRTFYHPERDKTYSLNLALAIYEWHCRHHLQHIKNALENPFEK